MSERGVSLVELCVVLAVLAVVMGVMLRYAMTGWMWQASVRAGLALSPAYNRPTTLFCALTIAEPESPSSENFISPLQLGCVASI